LQIPWYRQAAAVIPKYWYLKSTGTMLFIGVFFGAYFYLLKHPAYPITVMPITWLDRWIAFQPRALPIYLSLWVYVSLPPVFLTSRREMYRYGIAMAAACLLGLIIFYFWPTAVPAANIDWTRYPDVDFLKNLDASRNAGPSLHVSDCSFFRHLAASLAAPFWHAVMDTRLQLDLVYWHPVFHIGHTPACSDRCFGRFIAGDTGRLSVFATVRST